MDVGGGNGCVDRRIPQGHAVRRTYRQQDAEGRFDVGGDNLGSLCGGELGHWNVMIARLST